MNNINIFGDGGNKARTHTFVTHEFGVGIIGVKIGILIDNKSGDIGITGGVSFAEELGKVYIKTQFDTAASGGITDSITKRPEASLEVFAGVGFSVQESYDLRKSAFDQPTISVVEGTRGVAGVGIGVSLSSGISVDININHYFREVSDAVDRVVKELEGSSEKEKTSVSDSEYHAFQSKEHEYHLLDPDTHNFEKQLKESHRDIGELSREPLVKDSVLP